MDYLFGEYVSKAGLATLPSYRYHGVDNCLTTKLLNGFWERTVALVPRSVAPNVLTLAGGLCTFAALALVAACTPSRAALLAAAALLFAYETLDAIDGKQARRTKTSTPLGELFDHGVDALVFACMGPIVACAAGAPALPAVALSALVLPGFYLSHWEHYYKGEMVFGLVGPCEMQACVVAVLLAVAAAGAPVYEWRPRALFYGLLVFTVAFCFVSSAQYVVSTVRHLRKHKRSVGAAVLNLAPIATLLALAELRVFFEPEVVQTSARWAHFLANGLVFAYITQRLMVQRLFREPIVRFFPIFIPYGLCALNGFFRVLPVVHVAWAMVAIAAAQETLFAVSFVRQMSHHLGIHPFKVAPRVAEN